MAVLPGRRAGDPLAGSIFQRCLAVQTRCHFQAQPRPTAGHARNEADVECSRFHFEKAALGDDTGLRESGYSSSGDLRVGVLHGCHDARDAGGDQRIGTRRRATVVTAGLKRHISRRAARGVISGAKRMDLGVRLSGTMMPTFADDPAILDDDTAHPRIRCRRVEATLGEREIPSEKIGEMVMQELKKIDKVAYVRFASVYRNFEDVDAFSDLVREVSHPGQRRSR